METLVELQRGIHGAVSDRLMAFAWRACARRPW